jgi:hypothetical protein
MRAAPTGERGIRDERESQQVEESLGEGRGERELEKDWDHELNAPTWQPATVFPSLPPRTFTGGACTV